MGALIGCIIGLVIGGIIAGTRNKRAKAHQRSLTELVADPSPKSRAALDKRLPRLVTLMNDEDAERQVQRLVVLANLGDLDTLRAELTTVKGSAIHVATVRVLGHAALALKGDDPVADARRVEAECAALEARGVNALTRRALSAWIPIVRGAAGEHVVTEAERDEARRFQASDVIRALI